MKQVLINLLSNAIKYNKPGGAVTLACTLVAPDSIRISIQDTGVGLTPEQLAQLFQPFNRLGKGLQPGGGHWHRPGRDQAAGRTDGGHHWRGQHRRCGKRVLDRIEPDDAPQLALREVEHATLDAAAGVAAALPVRTLLYVEDNPANLKLVEQLVARRPDLRMLSAADGNLGVEFARAYQPDVILMDINLPGISGIEAMQVLRADPLTAHIPIIALSANALPRDIEKGLATGFFGYLTKPIKLNEFMDHLELALKFSASGLTPPQRSNRPERR